MTQLAFTPSEPSNVDGFVFELDAAAVVLVVLVVARGVAVCAEWATSCFDEGENARVVEAAAKTSTNAMIVAADTFDVLDFNIDFNWVTIKSTMDV